MVFPIAGGNESKGYEISNSLRFNRGDSPQLSKDMSGLSATSTKKFTTSFWLKLGNVPQTSYGGIIDVGGDHTIALVSDNTFYFFENGGNDLYWRLTRVFRDPSAWYNIIIIADSTLSTQTDRVKIYVNGVRETSFHNNSGPNQNHDFAFNTNNTRYVGRKQSTSSSLDGYLTEIHHIDGQAKAHTDFGEFDDNGVWVPIKYDGTYGNTGYYLEYKQTGTSANSSGIGADTSGNDNHFTPTNLAANDVTTDTCTNNFCTLNSVDKDGHTNAEGNLEVSGNVVYGMQRGTIGASSGKWYFEARLDVYQGDSAIALANEDENIFTRFSGETTNSVGYLADGRFFYNSSATNYSSLSAGNIFQIAFDADSGKIWIGKNNTWQNSGDPANGSGQVQTVSWNFFLPAARTVNNNGNGQLHFNFGQDSSFAGASTAQNNSDGKYGDFYYAPPSGFYALCTKRLAQFG